MSNVRTLTPEDFNHYGDALKGKSVGDTITDQESYELEKQYAEKNDQPVPQVVNASTGVTNIPSSIEGVEDESEAAESRRTRSKK